MSWESPAPVWESPVGRVLDSFFAEIHRVHPDYDTPLTIFGSAPIQLCLDDTFVSADADIMVLSRTEELRTIAGCWQIWGAGKTRPPFGLQLCPPILFKPTPHYLQRAQMETRHGLKIVIPHLRDILIAKLHRSRTASQDGLVAKDLRAFRRVRELTGGHPNEAELVEDLMACEPSFRSVDNETVNSFALNVEDLWMSLFGRRIDLAATIIAPARMAEAEAARTADGFVVREMASLRPSRD